MDSNMKNLKKTWLNSLSFLDNCTINSIIVVILLLYSSQIFSNINAFIGNFYNLGIIRLIVLILIIYIAPKDPTIAILLAISYIVSLHFMIENEYFVSNESEEQKNIVFKTNSMMKKSSTINMEETQNKPFVNSTSNNQNLQQGSTQPPYKTSMKKMNESFIPRQNMHEENTHHPMKKMTESFIPIPNMHEGNTNYPMKKKTESFIPIQNMYEENTHHPMKKITESFIPMPHMYEEQNADSYKMAKKSNLKTNVTSNQLVNKKNLQQNVLNKECINMYTPRFESLSDVCTPTATFKNELNAQGLNFPEGFNSTVVGSPLN